MKPVSTLASLPTAIAVVALFAAPDMIRAQPPASLVEVAPVVERKVAVGRIFTGTVVPPRTSVVGSAVDGRVDRADFSEGDLVRMLPDEGAERPLGQPLVQLRTRTFSIEMDIAVSERDLRVQELQQLEESIPHEITQKNAMLLLADAKMEYIKSRYERVQSLQADKAASRENMEEAKSAWLGAVQNREAAKSELVELQNTRETRITQARLRLRAADEKVAHLNDIFNKYTIRAPFDGFVIKKHTEVGAWLSRGDPVATIIELDPAEIDVFVPEHNISKVTVGASVSVTVTALADRVFVGKVSRVVPQADLRSRSFRVKIRLENPQYELKAGMLVSASIPVGDELPVLLVQKDALVLNGGQRAVVVARTEQNTSATTAHIVPVEIGVADGSWIQVTGDLAAGENVVIRGNERLRPGELLRTATDTGTE